MSTTTTVLVGSLVVLILCWIGVLVTEEWGDDG